MTANLRTLSVHVPMAIRRRGGRKVVIAPDGTPIRIATFAAKTRADPTLVKALARAFRWKRMLETGRHASISDIATAEKIDRGNVGSVLRLTLLAPDIVQAIVDGRQPADLALPQLLKPWPLEWQQQREALGIVETPREGLRLVTDPRRPSALRRHSAPPD
jgi:hypothetical protein